MSQFKKIVVTLVAEIDATHMDATDKTETIHALTDAVANDRIVQRSMPGVIEAFADINVAPTFGPEHVRILDCHAKLA